MKNRYVLEVQTDLYGAFASSKIYDMLKKSQFKKVSFRVSYDDKPLGLFNDSIDNCYERADQVSSAGSHSGNMCTNKDLRRIVLLSHYARSLEDKIKKLEG